MNRILFVIGLACCMWLALSGPAAAQESAGSPAVEPAVNGNGAAAAGENGDAAAAEEAPAAEEAKPEEEKKKDYQLEVTVSAEGVSLYAVNADAQLVFSRLGEETGLQVVVDDVVSRKITTSLSNMRASEIVAHIVAAYGLSCLQQDGLFMISEGIPKRPSTYLMSDIEAVPTEYVLAPNAKSLLPVFLQDHVKVNEEQNAVILSAPRDVLRKFREDVRQFDTPADQIAIDVLMVEFSTTEAEQFSSSLMWISHGHGGGAESMAGELTFQGTAALDTRFYAQVEALVQKGEARVRACPSVATVSGQSASIFIGQERFVSVPIQTTSYSEGNSIKAGVQLTMTPWTGGGGIIIVSLKPQVSVMSAPDPVTKLPQLNTRSASATVRVRDGQTIVIGGLLQRESHQARIKVPLLGDLPLLGGLFRAKRTEETMTNLVILVTPRVLAAGGAPATTESSATPASQPESVQPGAEAVAP